MINWSPRISLENLTTSRSWSRKRSFSWKMKKQTLRIQHICNLRIIHERISKTNPSILASKFLVIYIVESNKCIYKNKMNFVIIYKFHAHFLNGLLESKRWQKMGQEDIGKWQGDTENIFCVLLPFSNVPLLHFLLSLAFEKAVTTER